MNSAAHSALLRLPAAASLLLAGLLLRASAQ
jgi:hypothetical protein